MLYLTLFGSILSSVDRNLPALFIIEPEFPTNTIYHRTVLAL